MRRVLTHLCQGQPRPPLPRQTLSGPWLGLSGRGHPASQTDQLCACWALLVGCQGWVGGFGKWTSVQSAQRSNFQPYLIRNQFRETWPTERAAHKCCRPFLVTMPFNVAPNLCRYKPKSSHVVPSVDRCISRLCDHWGHAHVWGLIICVGRSVKLGFTSPNVVQETFFFA